MAVPTKDSLLVPYATNANDKLNANPGVYHMTADQASRYNMYCEPFVDAVKAVGDAKAAGVRSEVMVADKEEKKALLLKYARQVYAKVQADDDVSAASKIALGVHIRDHTRTPVGPPTARPDVDVVAAVLRTVTIHIHDNDAEGKRGRPANVASASVYSYVGAAYPSDPSQWTYQGTTGRSTHDIQFPDTVPAGAQVWVCAMWLNRRAEPGPVSLPVTTNVQGGGMQQAA